MGNQSSAKGRHVSGEDTAPTLTARNQFGDTPRTSFFSDSDLRDVPSQGGRAIPIFDLSRARHIPIRKDSLDMPLGPMRGRAHTLTPGTSIDQSSTSKLLPTVFKWEGGGTDVAVAGSFNGWKAKIPLAKSHADFYTIVDLPEGEHEYKFYVDGQWVLNPGEPSAPNGIGSANNKVLVKRSDFEVFEALALDSKAKKMQSTKGASIYSSEYGQEIPPRRTDNKYPGPPFLPPQLLQVILNKDTPAHCEPSLLPEPNHVMLNHLYALSIKDGVMVLSATHRFRKKYVTTLLYKPI